MKEKDLRVYLFMEDNGPLCDASIIKAPSSNVLRFKVDVMQEAETVNRNNRSYPWDILYEGCNAPFIVERLATNSLYCECGHPQEMTVQRQMRIDRTNATCMIKKLEFNKPYIGAEIETLATQMGKDLKALIEENGVKVAFSMRSLGKGKLDKNGVTVVQRPFRVITWDEVIHPSVSKAYMSRIVSLHEDANPDVKTDKLLLNESEAGKFYLESSDYAKKTLSDLGVDHEDVDSVIALKDGTLLVKKGSITYKCFCEAKIERALRNYLAD